MRQWQDKPVSPALLMAIYDLMRWGPTETNITPARFHFVVSKAGQGAAGAAAGRRQPQADHGGAGHRHHRL